MAARFTVTECHRSRAWTVSATDVVQPFRGVNILTYKDVDTRYPVDSAVCCCDKTEHQNGTRTARQAGMEYALLGFRAYWGWHWGCSIDQHGKRTNAGRRPEGHLGLYRDMHRHQRGVRAHVAQHSAWAGAESLCGHIRHTSRGGTHGHANRRARCQCRSVGAERNGLDHVLRVWLAEGATAGNLRDYNGNTVGTVTVRGK